MNREFSRESSQQGVVKSFGSARKARKYINSHTTSHQ